MSIIYVSLIDQQNPLQSKQSFPKTCCGKAFKQLVFQTLTTVYLTTRSNPLRLHTTSCRTFSCRSVTKEQKKLILLWNWTCFPFTFNWMQLSMYISCQLSVSWYFKTLAFTTFTGISAHFCKNLIISYLMTIKVSCVIGTFNCASHTPILTLKKQ